MQSSNRATSGHEMSKVWLVTCCKSTGTAALAHVPHLQGLRCSLAHEGSAACHQLFPVVTTQHNVHVAWQGPSHGMQGQHIAGTHVRYEWHVIQQHPPRTSQLILENTMFGSSSSDDDPVVSASVLSPIAGMLASCDSCAYANKGKIKHATQTWVGVLQVKVADILPQTFVQGFSHLQSCPLRSWCLCYLV